MKKILVGFSRAKSPWKIGSKLIQEVEKRDFGHAYIEIEQYGETIIAQASHGMVNLMNKELFLDGNIIVKEYNIPSTNSSYEDMMKFIYQNVGKPYSVMQLVLIGIKKILKLEIRTYNKDKYYICSEFAARICKILKIIVPEELDYVTPSDLDIILSEQIGNV